MIVMLIDLVSVYVNNNRGFGSNVNSLVIMICIINLIRLVPGALSLFGNMVAFGGFFVWLGVVVSIMVINFGKFLSDLVPSAPIALIPVLYLIEVISYLVRPFAIFLRISINLGCRHLLLVICGIMGVWGNMVGLILILVLELGVAVVQSFVYGMILVL
jgi:F-type H+-transporting ATPase subunit a